MYKERLAEKEKKKMSYSSQRLESRMRSSLIADTDWVK